MYIEKINSPKDLKSLSVEQLGVVVEEVRQRSAIHLVLSFLSRQ